MKTVLVVDDEFDLLQTICAVLEMEGYRALQAADGRTALQELDQAQPDLVVSDVMMPYMSGYELVSQIRRNARSKDLPVILISSIEENLHPAGAWQAVLAKPFEIDRFLQEVQRQIGPA